MLHPDVVAKSTAIQERFRTASPFPHVVIDGFFAPAVAQRLRAEFPNFEERYARNEMGKLGGKAVRMNVRDISPTYAEVDRYIQTPEFLQQVSRLTGIPDLLYDSEYVGGGTHENVHGQGLDPHVDFNYLPRTKWHRRLNLIVYLNEQWEESWGGCLELHSDPWDTRGNRVHSVLPLLNRCVIFETSEISWHGFQRIDLPEPQRSLSRKSFAIYLYTKERPAEQVAPSHATIYVPDVRPPEIAAGLTLTDEHVATLDRRFTNLRNLLRYLYGTEKKLGQQIQDLEYALAEARAAARAPLEGMARQPEPMRGMWPDSWVGREFAFTFAPTEPARTLEVELFVPKELGQQQLVVTIGGNAQTHSVASGNRRLTLPIDGAVGRSIAVVVTASQTFSPAALGKSSDGRELAWRLLALRLQR